LGLSLVEFEKAVLSLEKALTLHNKGLILSSEKLDVEMQTVFRDACIQRFEYCIEMSWKLSMKILGSTTAAARPAVREMARNTLIKNPETWFEFIDARNETSHSYDENIAQKVFKKVQEFYPEVIKLLAALRAQI
jgi:nucleotidyltransferase substrate binding protein (TIGR01987 family)